MDLSQSLNLNTAVEKPLFDATFLNLEYIFNKILEFFRFIFGSGVSSPVDSGGSVSSSSSISFFSIFLFSMALIFIFIISYCLIRIFEIRKKEEEYLEHEIEEYAKHKAEKEKESNGLGNFRNERWENVLGYLSSNNQSDWKLAVIEADSMLEDLTDQLELDGMNLGERLKSSNKEKFKTLDDAWEAHLVRNKIAHDGSQFELSQHEANRIITLYENVFREFGFI
ncbi:MAG: hypothetical protein WCX46_02675 [Candidatus Paceibacterota bacterium]